MKREMKYYYILKLRLSTFLKILKEGRHGDIGSVTYVEQTVLVSASLKLLKKLKFFSFPFYKMQPRKGPPGPVLYLSECRNDKGEVIALDFYHKVLEIRKRIVEQLKESFADFHFFKNKNPISMIVSCFGLKIAESITPAVCLAFYARWQKLKEEGTEKIKKMLVIPRSNWCEILAEELKDYAHEVVVEGRDSQSPRLLYQTMKHTARAVIHMVYISVVRPFQKGSRLTVQKILNEYNSDKGKIMIRFIMGLDKERRNDLPFYHSSTLAKKADRLLIIFKNANYLPSEHDMEWIRRSGVKCLAETEIKKSGLDIPLWRPTVIFKKYLLRFYSIYLKTFFQLLVKRKKHGLWMLDIFWEIEMINIFWKDFFLTNRVKIVVNSIPSNLNFVPNMAISEIDGIAVEFERSIRFDYCTYIHNSPNHVYFATGPYSLTQTPETSFSLFTIQTGGINIIENSRSIIKGIEELKRNSEILITVFDEVPNDIFLGNSVHEMYQTMIDLAKTDHRFSLLIKTKKPQILGNMKDISDEISHLCQKGKCLVADWRVSPSTAISSTDLVVSAISTPAFESVLMGARTILYYPMRAGCSIFYSNNGLNRRIFEDNQLMSEAIKRYFNGQDDSVGDCSDIATKLDPFGDRKGGWRMGQYLEWCLDGYDSGLSREEVLKEANSKYTEKWGTGVVTSENSYEAQNTAG